MKRTTAIASALALVAAIALQSPATAASNNTLTLGFNTAPISLDPTKAATGSWNLNYTLPLYATVLETDKNGKYVAGLAEKWGYTNKTNTAYSFTLRKGLKFSDGTALNAAAVVKSIDYFKTGSGPSNAYFKDLTLKAKDAYTVTITSKVPNPMLDFLLSNRIIGSGIINPKVIATPEKLSSDSYGAGAYVLDEKKTIPNSVYVYTPNKYYYNQAAIKFKTITIKVITNVDAALQALKTGQIDVMSGSVSTVDAAKRTSGVKVGVAANNWNGLFLIDRNGEVTKPMGDVRVRQALNYAVDRVAITKAVYGAYGTPTAVPGLPGVLGYDAALEKTYSYNPTKAKQLLAAAGYANGFDLPVNYTGFDPQNAKMVEAIAGQLAAVGVNLKLKSNTNFGEWVGDYVSKKYSATGLGGMGCIGMYIDSQFAWAPTAIMNVFGTSIPGFDAAFNKMANAPASQVDAAAKAAMKIVVQQAAAMPIATVKGTYYYRSNLKGFEVGTKFDGPTPLALWSK